MTPKRSIGLGLATAALGLLVAAIQPALAETVKITPLGSHDGEFCRFDRAMFVDEMFDVADKSVHAYPW